MNTWKRITVMFVVLLGFMVSGCGPDKLLGSTPSTTTTQKPTTGQVKGVLIATETEEPIEAEVNLLATKLNTDGSTTFNPEDYDKRSILKIKTISGSFIFEKVQPGTYEMMATMECTHQQNGEEKIGKMIVSVVDVNIAAGQVIDLGTIYVPLNILENNNNCA